MIDHAEKAAENRRFNGNRRLAMATPYPSLSVSKIAGSVE
jgi:hypothetical protein